MILRPNLYVIYRGAGRYFVAIFSALFDAFDCPFKFDQVF